MEHAAHAAQLGPTLVTHAGYLWLIPLLPLVGSFVNAVFGWRFERSGKKALVHVVGVGAMVLSLAVAVVAFVQMVGMEAGHRFLQNTLWNALTAGRFSFDVGFSLDPLSMMMVLIITFIGTLIHVFSIGYMWNDEEKAYWRFFMWLNLFVFSMLLLVMGDSFAMMFFGWEGVGLCSYGLIAYYYRDREKAAAGMKAFVVNRFGDFGFLAGLLLLFWGLGGAWSASGGGEVKYQPTPEVNAVAAAANADDLAKVTPTVHGVKVGPTLNFRELRDQVVIEETGVAEHLKHQKVWGFGLLAAIGVLLFVGAMGKSAQIPLYVWLPDAMAGPTPVSALIHAATMVTAGVYMVARLNFVFALAPSAMAWVALVGAVTALFAASIGFFQYDIKKVLAYSTVSQLGFMFIGVGVGAYWAGVYHLLTHAFFKACLFLGSGSVILGCHHEQDMRKMGGLRKFMPVTHATYLFACIAIAGFPIANGFYSKDEILWKAFSSGHLELFGHPTPWLGPLIYVVGIITATGTSFYMFRSYYMTFSGTYRGVGGHHDEHNEDPHSAVAAPVLASSHAAHASDGAAHAAHAGVHAPVASPLHAKGHDPHGDPHAGHGHAAHDDHGAHGAHGGTPHESPRTITWVLATLAIGSFLTLFLGIPAAWTHRPPLLEHWLEPVLSAEVPFTAHPHVWEYAAQAIGVAAGFVGWIFARALYKDARSEVPARLQAKFIRAWTVVYNKYYVDELYQATVVRGSIGLGRLFSFFDGKAVDGVVNFAGWFGRKLADVDDALDRYFVDGAVNAVANATIGGGRTLRKIQTGRVQTYLYGALAGGLAVIVLNFLVG